MKENKKFLCKSCFWIMLNFTLVILLSRCGNMFGSYLEEDEINILPPNDQAKNDYANLSNLAVSGNVTISFDSNTLVYSVTVSNNITEIQVTPTAESDPASITVNGNSVTSGSASAAISLSIGENIITIVVTAEDGVTSKTYTITITRQNQSNNDSGEPEVILFRLSGTAPGDGTRDVTTNTSVSITFDKTMDASTLTTNTSDTQCKGNFKISADDFETCVQMKDSPTPDDSDRRFTITPLVPLDYATTYTIAINTYVQDTEGNSWESTYISPKGFTTIAGPFIRSSDPADNAVSIALASAITVTFDRSMDASTITTNTGSSDCTGSFQVSADDFTTCVQMSPFPVSSNSDMTFSVTPSIPLDYSTRYRIRITAGAQDTDGYPLPDYTTPAGFLTLNAWTWISGSDLIDQPGVYGSLGVAASTNVPGCRRCSVSWIDSDGNFWLFGGDGADADGFGGLLNDLWKFNGANWTWVSGSDLVDQPGVYGIIAQVRQNILIKFFLHKKISKFAQKRHF